jgi:hypothetical protein
MFDKRYDQWEVEKSRIIVNHKIDNQDRRKKFIADQMAALQFANGTLRS